MSAEVMALKPIPEDNNEIFCTGTHVPYISLANGYEQQN
jgi:hypothetical protein